MVDYIKNLTTIDHTKREASFVKLYSPNSETPGRVAQSVTCLTTDACLTAIPGVVRSRPGPIRED